MSALLEARGLVKHYRAEGGFLRLRRARHTIRAVDGLSFAIERGQTLALVGESGSGKTTVARLVLRLTEPTAGDVLFAGESVFSLDGAALRALRRRMQIVFQDPYSSLNPRMTVRATLREPLEIHGLARGGELERRVTALLEEVGLDAAVAGARPHELSGGQRQRVGIARALSVEPELLVCDEPVSALDVSVQAQILNLLSDLRHNRQLTVLLIAHDLAVVRHMAEQVAVMYLGRIVERAPAEVLYRAPRHPYTAALLSAVPLPDPAARRQRIVLAGEVVSHTQAPSGCPFHQRCPHPKKNNRCRFEAPALREITHRQFVACHFAEEPM
jgi:oligopeptide/dipeptide ABC transporter ATP-binding protein